MLFRATTDAAERFGHAAPREWFERFRREHPRCERCGAATKAAHPRYGADGEVERHEALCGRCAVVFGPTRPGPHRTPAGARRAAELEAALRRAERLARG
jgi:hypothetical protein